MARYSLWNLAGMRPAGHSHDIGTTERRPRLTATLSQLNASGNVEFGPEIPIEVEFGFLQLPPTDKDSEQFRVWVGFEVQTMEKKLRDATLVMATYPYSTDWCDWSDFKPIFKGSREKRLEPFRTGLNEINDKLRSRSKLPYEMFETRNDRFTARLSLPTRTEGLSVTARPRLKEKERVWKKVESSINRRHRGSTTDVLWCFGACLEFEKCKEALRSSEQAMNLVARLEDGTLFEKYRSTGAAAFRRIGSEARSYHKTVLESAIVKALGGRLQVSDNIPGQGKPTLAGPLMARIYQQTMYNLVRRLHETDTKIRTGKDSEHFVSRPDKQELRPFEDLVDYYAPYALQGLTEAARHEMDHRLDRGSEADQRSACAFLAAIAKAGFQLPLSLRLRLRKICDDMFESAEVRRNARTVLDIIAKDGLPDCED